MLKVAKNDPRDLDNPILQIRRLYCAFVQGVFQKLAPERYRWLEEDTQTKIYITSENTLDTDVLQMRPGISFTRAPMAMQHLGFDDWIDLNQGTGAKTKSVLLPGTMIINCCSSVDLESEEIAWFTAENLWLIRDVLQHQGFYDVGRNLQVGSPSPANAIIQNDQGKEWYCTAVTSPFVYNRTSRMVPLNKMILDEVRMSIAVNNIKPVVSAMPVEVFGTNQSPDAQAPGTTYPHPLNPAKTVTLKTIRQGTTWGKSHVSVPISQSGVKDSGSIRRVIKLK